MSNELNNTDTSDYLLSCEICGSTDWCLVKANTVSFTWIKCRQCDKTFGLAEKTKY